MNDRGKSYDRVARIYDAAAHLYSGGKIRALKAAQIGALQPGQKILYAGVGDGEDAVLATNRQVSLTLLDLSQGMLDRAKSKFQALDAEGSLELICSDVLKHQRPGHYDVVVANFFLNVFTEPMMKAVLAHLATLLKPGGKLLIGRFLVSAGAAGDARDAARLLSHLDVQLLVARWNTAAPHLRLPAVFFCRQSAHRER
jgi:demethylphylloquinol methyltransferase